MKFILVSILCALMVKTVITMPVGVEPAVQSDQLAVVPLEKSTPILATEHILRREVSESDASTVSEHREGETIEEHAKHAHLPVARLDEKDEKPEPTKEQSEESKSLVEEVKAAEEKKDDILLKNADSESALSAKAVAADIITPIETLVPIPAEEVAPTSVEKKNDAPAAEGKSAPAKVIDSELNEEIELSEKKSKGVEKTEEILQPNAKSSVISSEPTALDAAEEPKSSRAAPESETPKDEKKIEAVIAESGSKAAEEPKEEIKKAEDKTDRVTRGTEEAIPADAAQPAQAAAAPAPAIEVAATVAESEEKLIVGKKEEKFEPHEKLIESAEAAKEEKTHELAKSTEESSLVQAKESAISEVAADEPQETDKIKQLNDLKVEEPNIQAKSASAQVDAQPSEAAAVPTEVKPEPVVDTIKTKSESIETSNESVEAVKAENSSSSEEKSSEEDQSAENLEKSTEAKSVNLKKDEIKAEELPKPQEIKEPKVQG